MTKAVSRVLLADDHRMFSEGLRRILEPQFEIVGTVESGRDLIPAAERLRPDVIVADISMPSLNGIDAARRIRKMPRAPKIIFLTMHEDATFAAAAFRAGASGYVLKRSGPADIIAAIQEAIQGRIYISSLVASDLLSTLMDNGNREKKFKAELTSRQREILQLVAEGKVPKEIAAILRISVRTVEFHKYRIMAATGARTIAELTRYAIAHGVVPLS
ncbi:MAG TPA: response regulator transcription factor [Terriglobia bacterium]|nr:response regulator transcription factor [Terriglobia bacterium]